MSPRRALGSHLRQPPGLLALLSSHLNFFSLLGWGKKEEPGGPYGWEQGRPRQGLGEAKQLRAEQSEGLPGGGGLCCVGSLGRLEYARSAFWGPG